MTWFRGWLLAPARAGIRRESARPGWPLAGGIVAGTALDAVFGDPRRGHPVAAFGRAAQALQQRIYRDSVLRGVGYAALCVLAAMAPECWRSTSRGGIGGSGSRRLPQRPGR